MAAELGLLSLTQHQKLAQSQHNQLHHQPNLSLATGAWMWNPKQAQEDDDSWEVRAFEQDTGNLMGTTWPPRSYTCTFCRREFRSAQALGGHMNVHRRDRARLHQTQPAAASVNHISSSSPTSSSTFIIPTQEFASNGGLCLLYQLPNPSGIFTSMNACTIDSPSTLLSISPYHPPQHFVGPSLNLPVAPAALNSSHFHNYNKAGVASSASTDSSNDARNGNNKDDCKEPAMEEVDLELRLGQRSTPS